MQATITSPLAPAAVAAPVRLNLALAAVHLALLVYLLFVFPMFVLPHGLAWALTLLPVALASNAYWSLLHEAFHGKLHPRPGINNALGRMLAVAFGSSFRLLRTGHLLHHKHNRTPLDCPEYYDPLRTPPLRARLGYYFHLLGGLYLAEIFSPLLFLLPRRLRGTVDRLAGSGTLAALTLASQRKARAAAEVRSDGVMAWTLLLGSAWCYGPDVWILVAAVLVRALLLSLMDLAYHYGARDFGPEQGYDLRLHRPGEWLLLNFNYHGTHHRNPALPWRALRARFAEEGRSFETDFGHAVLRQLRGPLPNP